LALHGRLVSYRAPIPILEPLVFLRYFRGRERFFWRDGRNDIVFAGGGVAADLMGWGEERIPAIERQVRALFAPAAILGAKEPLAAPRLFGGFAFTREFAPDNAWVGFNPAHFILPHYQLVQSRGRAWLTINVLLDDGEPPAEVLPQLREALAACRLGLEEEASLAKEEGPQKAVGGVTEGRGKDASDYEVSYPMSFDDWSAMIRAAQERFRSGELEKVVLARICEVRTPRPLAVHDALAYLLDHYPRCYAFLFEPQPNHAFLGATPELLARTRGRAFESMALAGSIQRGATPDEDARLAAELLASAKDRHEHALVVDSLRRRLQPLAASLEIPETPGVLTLSNIQHLHTPVRGQLKPPPAGPDGALALVEILHPTPALGGSPRERSLGFIQEMEPVPRGWYAAPVGWIDNQLDGAFAVAIRSAVVQERRVWLYAGAGIVADSVPAREWEETGWKFRPMLGALGIGEKQW
jgi:menaquinone-specific isochorismate synthase